MEEQRLDLSSLVNQLSNRKQYTKEQFLDDGTLGSTWPWVQEEKPGGEPYGGSASFWERIQATAQEGMRR